MEKNKLIRLAISLIAPLAILLIPTSDFPLVDTTVVEQRVIALFVLAAFFWILEPIPIYATSVLVIVLELIMISDKGWNVLIVDSKDAGFGTLLNY
ncbi:MAG: sodium-dependent dicarboxylate transporter 2/3/5, partial [Bacteroidia bacterium]